MHWGACACVRTCVFMCVCAQCSCERKKEAGRRAFCFHWRSEEGEWLGLELEWGRELMASDPLEKVEVEGLLPELPRSLPRSGPLLSGREPPLMCCTPRT